MNHPSTTCNMPKHGHEDAPAPCCRPSSPKFSGEPPTIKPEGPPDKQPERLERHPRLNLWAHIAAWVKASR